VKDSKRIIGIDPGVTSGVAIIEYSKDFICLENAFTLRKIEEGEQGEQLYIGLYRLLPYIKSCDMLIYEGFHNSSITKYAKITLEIIGIVKYMTYTLDKEIIVVEQMPSVRTGYLKLSNDFLKLHKVKNKHHIKDATAHILRYINKEDGINVQTII